MQIKFHADHYAAKGQKVCGICGEKGLPDRDGKTDAPLKFVRMIDDGLCAWLCRECRNKYAEK